MGFKSEIPLTTDDSDAKYCIVYGLYLFDCTQIKVYHSPLSTANRKLNIWRHRAFGAKKNLQKSIFWILRPQSWRERTQCMPKKLASSLFPSGATHIGWWGPNTKEPAQLIASTLCKTLRDAEAIVCAHPPGEELTRSVTQSSANVKFSQLRFYDRKSLTYIYMHINTVISEIVLDHASKSLWRHWQNLGSMTRGWLMVSVCRCVLIYVDLYA